MAIPGSNSDGVRTPRWVKVSGSIAIALVLLVVIAHFASGGVHHHMAGSDNVAGHAMHSSGTEPSDQQP